MELKDYLTIIQRQKIPIILVALGVFGCWYFFTLHQEKPIYSASAKAMHKTMSPASYFFTFLTQKRLWPYVQYAAALDLARSEDTLAIAAEYLRQGVKLQEEDRLVRLNPYPGITSADIAGSVEITEHGRESTVFYIKARSEDPQLAVDMANAVAWALKRRVKEVIVGNLKRIQVFIEDELKKAKAKMQHEHEHLERLKQALGYDPLSTAIQDEIKSLKATKRTKEEQLSKAEAQELSLVERITSKRDILERLTRGEGITVKLPRNRVYEGLLRDLSRQELKLTEAEEKYRFEHPVIQAILKKIALLQIQIQREEKKMEQLRVKLFEQKKAQLIQQSKALIEELEAQQTALKKRKSTLADTIKKIQETILEKEQEWIEFLKKRDEYMAQQNRYNESASWVTQLKAKASELKEEEIRMPDLLSIEQPAREYRCEGKRSKYQLPFIIALSLIIAIGFGYLLDYLDDRVRTAYDVKRYMNWQAIGVIPLVKQRDVLIKDVAAKSPIFEVYGRLATIINTVCRQEGVRSFIITSVAEKEGKSTLVANLGTAFARMGKRTVLLDADMRRPALHHFFDVDNSQGLSSYLSGKLVARAELAQIREEGVEAIQIGELDYLGAITKPTRVENLSVIPAGPLPPNPVALLESQEMKTILSELKKRFDIILLDTPPIESTTDPLLLGTLVERVILVISCWATRKYQLTWGKRMLTDVGAHMAGVVLNKSTIRTKGYYYYYYESKSYVERG
jgi:Mrp family chromosome partitioning ATPase